MQIFTSSDTEATLCIIKKNVVGMINVVEKFFPSFNVFADAVMIPLRHERLECLLDVAIELDFGDKTGDVAAFVEHKVMPSAGVFIERESVLASAGLVDAVGAERSTHPFYCETEVPCDCDDAVLLLHCLENVIFH